MNDNQVFAQKKLNTGIWAIISFILGLIAFINGIITVCYPILFKKPYITEYLYTISGSSVFLKIVFFISLIGIILGVLGFKSQKKKLAISGIILSIIGLIITFLFYFFIFGMSTY